MGSVGKKTGKRYLKSEQTHRQTDTQTDTHTHTHGQESPGWLSLFKLTQFFVVVENIQKHQFFLGKLIGQ